MVSLPKNGEHITIVRGEITETKKGKGSLRRCFHEMVLFEEGFDPVSGFFCRIYQLNRRSGDMCDGGFEERIMSTAENYGVDFLPEMSKIKLSYIFSN